MGLSLQEIKEDIVGYEDRIHLAKLSLANLPKGRLPLKEHKKREKQRREYEAECSHCFQLIEYANEGIELRLKEAGVSCELNHGKEYPIWAYI
jgi:hypothetical protein